MSDRRRVRVLMIAFSETRYDGRVLRAAEAISNQYDVVIAGLGDCPIRSGVPIRYLPVNISEGPRWLMHLSFFMKIILIGLQVRPKIVHAHDYFVAFHGWVIAKLLRAYCAYDAHEFLPGINERSHFRHRVFMFLERIVINRYDLIIATSDERSRALGKYYRLRESPIVVGNIAGAEEEILESSQDEKVTDFASWSASPHNLPLVVYQGSMDVHSRCLDNLVRAFTELRGKCILIMAGDGPDLNYLRDLTKQLGLEEYIKFTGRLSRSSLIAVMHGASIGVVIYSNKELNNLLCTPNKIHEYTRAGLAVVASNQPPLVQILCTHRIGELFDPDKHASIRHALVTVLSDLNTYKSNVPEFIVRNDWSKDRMKLIHAYKGLLNRADMP